MFTVVEMSLESVLGAKGERGGGTKVRRKTDFITEDEKNQFQDSK